MDLDTPEKINYRLLSVGGILVDEFVAIPENAGRVECEIDNENERISFPYGQKILTKEIEYSVGGDAADVAVGMSRLGIKSLVWATIGDDWTTKLILDTMAKESVGTSLITTQPASRGPRGIIVNYAGERTLFSYHPRQEENIPEEMPEVEWIYLTSMSLDYEQTYRKVVEWKAGEGVKLAFNPGSQQLSDGVAKWREVLESCDLLFLNKEESELVTGIKGEPKKLLLKLLAMGPKTVVVTDGPAGAYVAETGGGLWKSSIYKVPVVETTGAGDAFATGFLAATMEGKSIEDGLKWGMVESAAVISKVGAQTGLLHKEDFDDWLNKDGGVKVEKI